MELITLQDKNTNDLINRTDVYLSEPLLSLIFLTNGLNTPTTARQT